MTYNPEIHHRRSIRLRNYDYANAGAYFVTLCTIDRCCYFDQFPRLREIVNNEWNHIPERFFNVDLDEYIIMPNHFHGIITCRDTPSGYPTSGHSSEKSGHPQGDAPTLGKIVGAFKSLCVTAWLREIKTDTINARGKFWQTNYYEHVVRNEDEMTRIRQYIIDNPARWELDKENPMSREQQQQLEKWMI
jgi:REP element-mobilizing transposase RayT